ncbi:probable cysteine--tRNA ligase, mitochondrial [Lucilia sericata]|uniref:probable cysteine--tRNA ligase, mitochondrial n=1 Tax=Lucilia sericata TaxID=13632 RepID=UPI0018A83F35|nr:probable cysteine--tRNA ligase, mitochondrial [Lucilia sericata]
MFKTNCIMTKRRLGYFINPLRTMCSQQRWFKPDGIDTGIRIYNCAARRQVPLILPNENFLTWYTCGPTVYDSSHLGHASCYVKLDIIQRILRQHFNFNIVSAMNITDIDDKIIKRSQESGKDWREISHYYETEFWSDLRKLNVIEPNIKLRVTEHMPKIISYIEDIVRKQCAYVSQDSSVYFDVKQFPIYGKLQNLNLNDDEALKSQNKLSPFDFALWKARKSENEPSWPSPWGAGRPGWHIECSTLANMIFGKSIDIHAGGMDLRFPHHENEEAQSCVYHDTRQWVNYWLHTGHLNIKGESEKMSKSLKNTISIDEMLKEFTADDFRMACALSNYKNSMDYSKELMETAKNTLNKFKTFKADCLAYLNGKKIGSNLNANTILQNLHYAKSNIDSCIRDDFDTARSISILLDQISGVSRCINTNTNATVENETSSCLDAIAAVNNYVDYILQSFGFSFADAQRSINDKENININAIIEDILKTRENIRQQAVMGKNKELFKVCDDLRNCLRNHGIEIRDHSQGSSWNFIENKN